MIAPTNSQHDRTFGIRENDCVENEGYHFKDKGNIPRGGTKFLDYETLLVCCNFKDVSP